MDQEYPKSPRYDPPPLVWAALIVGGLAAWLVVGMLAVAPFVLGAALIYPVGGDNRPSQSERIILGYSRPKPWWSARSASDWEAAWGRVGIAAVIMLALVGLAAILNGV